MNDVDHTVGIPIRDNTRPRLLLLAQLNVTSSPCRPPRNGGSWCDTWTVTRGRKAFHTFGRKESQTPRMPRAMHSARTRLAGIWLLWPSSHRRGLVMLSCQCWFGVVVVVAWWLVVVIEVFSECAAKGSRLTLEVWRLELGSLSVVLVSATVRNRDEVAKPQRWAALTKCDKIICRTSILSQIAWFCCVSWHA